MRDRTGVPWALGLTPLLPCPSAQPQLGQRYLLAPLREPTASPLPAALERVSGRVSQAGSPWAASARLTPSAPPLSLPPPPASENPTESPISTGHKESPLDRFLTPQALPKRHPALGIDRIRLDSSEKPSRDFHLCPEDARDRTLTLLPLPPPGSCSHGRTAGPHRCAGRGRATEPGLDLSWRRPGVGSGEGSGPKE